MLDAMDIFGFWDRKPGFSLKFLHAYPFSNNNVFKID